MTTPIQPLPTPPQPSDTPSDFNSKAFSLLGALPNFVMQANAMGGEMTALGANADADSQAAAASAAAAGQSAAAASGSAAAAGNSADQAAGSAGVANQSKFEAQAAAVAAAKSAQSVDTAYLRDRANHTGALNWAWAAYGGSANAVTLAPAFARTAYAAGDQLRFRATATNTGAATINVGGLGAKTAVTVTGAALPAGYIRTDVDTVCVYDGTQFIVQREVEIGSNANGQFVKEENGLLTCRHSMSTDTATSTSYGSIFATSSPVNLPFPHAFAGVAADVSVKRADRWVAGPSAGWGATNTVSTTALASHVISGISGGTCRIGYEATGRWY